MKHRQVPYAIAAIVMFILAACAGQAQPTPSASLVTLPRVRGSDLRLVTGQAVYVPAYTEVFDGGPGATLRLGVTLVIHNTDVASPIIIQSMQYFNTEGHLVRDYAQDPVAVAPLATTGVVVPMADTSGGWGSNFIVRWGAEQAVSEPIIEAIMVSTQGTQGISMISPGRVISATVPEVLPQPGN